MRRASRLTRYRRSAYPERLPGGTADEVDLRGSIDQADPGRLKPFTTDLQPLSRCLIANSKHLHAILSLPGNRSAGLSSLPAMLPVRY